MKTCLAKGIDVSSNNAGGTGLVDFEAVKRAGYQFAIIRVGYGTTEKGKKPFYGYISKSFVPQIEGAKSAGLDVGAYWYSDAVTVEEARLEAETCLRAVKPYQLDYPVFFDQEYSARSGIAWGVSRNKQLRTDMCKAFCGAVRDAGYYAALYSSTDWLQNWVDDSQLTEWDKWVAQYASRCTYEGEYTMWQHHGSLPGYVGSIPGVTGAVDLNDCYVDYPALVRASGLNGFGPVEPEVPEKEKEAVTLEKAGELLRSAGVEQIKL